MAITLWSNTNTITVDVVEGVDVGEIVLGTNYVGIDNVYEISFFIIEGSLPPGLRLVFDKNPPITQDNPDGKPILKIIGTPSLVKKTKGYECKIRGVYRKTVVDKIVGIVVNDIPYPIIWTVETGYNFGTLNERIAISIDLPIAYTDDVTESDVSYSVISGSLPPGLRLQGDKIIGVPFEVVTTKNYTFVVRATYFDVISDRTFNISIQGADEPVWITDEGTLPVGSNDTYFVLDNTYIDYQLRATDKDLVAGGTLSYFVATGDGELPPGLVLTQAGRLVGWIQPVLRISKVPGYYDTSPYDNVAYDFGYLPANGYDSYIYDSLTYDFSTTTVSPRQLNRNYEFIVTITDGTYISKRKFRMFVVGNDFFRSDTVVIEVSTGIYTADVSYLRAPIWLTPADLGTKRANNYHTVQFEIYKTADPEPIIFNLDQVNPEVYGIAISKNSNENRAGNTLVRIKDSTATPRVGQKISLKEYITGANADIYTISNVQTIAAGEYLLTLSAPLSIGILDEIKIGMGSLSVIPPGMNFSPYTVNLLGKLPYQTAIVKTYQFTLSATRLSGNVENAVTRKTFTLRISGEVESSISWITEPDLGTIEANLVSTLFVKAVDLVNHSTILYRIASGNLPPGLNLNLEGEIVGKVNQFYRSDINLLGLTRFIDTEGDFTLDFGNTTIDKSFSFTVEAKDIYGFSSITRTFTLSVDAFNDRYYSNLIVRPFLKQEQRDLFKTFINDTTIFDNSVLYRPNDPNFGIQTELKMLVFAGIETKDIDFVSSIMGRNHSKKRFILGPVKKAQAKIPGTNSVVYDVVYIEVIDPLEINGKHLPANISTSSNPWNVTVDQTNTYYNGPFDTPERYWGATKPFSVTADRNDMYATDPGTSIKQPSSISLWRTRIKEIGLNDRKFLPLWMRTVQTGSVVELDFVPAIPLCYCKPGTADTILLNIKNNNFDFKKIDYVIDRYIIDKYIESDTVKVSDKYIVFRNDRTTIT